MMYECFVEKYICIHCGAIIKHTDASIKQHLKSDKHIRSIKVIKM